MSEEDKKSGLTFTDLIGIALMCGTLVAIIWILFG